MLVLLCNIYENLLKRQFRDNVCVFRNFLLVGGFVGLFCGILMSL